MSSRSNWVKPEYRLPPVAHKGGKLAAGVVADRVYVDYF